MDSIKSSASSRYNSFDSRSSHQSDPSSSTELKPTKQSSLKRFIGGSTSRRQPSPAPMEHNPSSRAIVRTKSDLALGKVKNEKNLSAMVRKFMDKGSGKPQKAATLVIPVDFIAEDMKKTARKGSNFAGLHQKLFSKGSGSGSKEKKALMEVKANTRTLAMVLRSERELLNQNKDQEAEIIELKLMLEHKNNEVEKLKDLCLKQREEIKSLKSAVLFPDDMNSQFQELVEQQGSELKQAKQLIPNLQKQVSSLTGQLQCLAEDLAEVKADKYSSRGCSDSFDAFSSPKTPAYDQENTNNSLEFSSEDRTVPGSPDDMFLKDFNPCLTPYYAQTKSKDFKSSCDSPKDERSPAPKQLSYDNSFGSHVRRLSKSSDCYNYSNSGKNKARAARRSDESKCTYGKPMSHMHL